MELTDLQPKALRCSFFDGYELKHKESSMRIVYHYEIEYYLESDGGVEINGEFVKYNTGDIGIRKPGDIVKGTFPYKCYIICIDMLGTMDNTADYIFGTLDNAQLTIDVPELLALPNKIPARKTHTLSTLIREIFKNSLIDSQFNKFQEQTNLQMLLCELIKLSYDQTFGYHRTVLKAIDFIKENYCEDIPIDSLIESSGLSKSYFHKCFKSFTGVTPNKLITQLRIEKAKVLFESTNLPISKVGQSSGFFDKAYFTATFKKYTGLTPTQYIAQNKY